MHSTLSLHFFGLLTLLQIIQFKSQIENVQSISKIYVCVCVISYYNCPKNSRETCLKSIFELLVHSCESTGFMKLSKDSDSDDWSDLP